MDIYERMRELRAEDPHGRQSDNDLRRVAIRESLNDRIDALPDIDERDCDLKSILRDMLEIL